MSEGMSHHEPWLYFAGRHGSWGGCLCGWESRTWSSVIGVHYEFGQHLVQIQKVEAKP